MQRRIFLIAICFMTVGWPLASGASPKLDLNDVTWLWPAPQLASDLERTIAVELVTAADGGSVWSDEQFADVMKAADSDAAKVGEHRIKLPDAVRVKKAWRIAAFRVDPTAPGGHEIIRQGFGEKPQLRIILQPVTEKDGTIEVHDIAIHLVYDFVKTEGTNEQPDRDRFKQIIADLDELKKKTEEAGFRTSGAPLGVHPGLQADVSGLREEVLKFLGRHLRADRLSAMAIMGLDGPEPWIFLALSNRRSPDKRFVPVALLPAQMINFRPGSRGVFPTPTVNNLNPIPSTFVMPAEEQDRRGVATAVLFQSNIDPEAFAVIGKNADGQEVRNEKVRNRDIPDLIADPTRSHFFNTDCVSCHTETRRRLRLSLSPGEFAFRQDGEPPQIDPAVLPSDDWNVRNLGWFTPHEFIGGGPPAPTVTQRTANETAEVVQFIERHYRQDTSPGVEPNHPDDGDQANQADEETSVDEPVHDENETTYLEQGWTPEERQDFYFIGQGSQLAPYQWFLHLELADSEELLRSDRHLASLGCIPQPPSEPLNPDGLPIGFVKDSNPSTIAMKRGMLGADFKQDRYPPTGDWLGFTCAACHTANLTHQGATVRIDGGAAMTDMESFLSALAMSMRATVDDDEKFQRFQNRIKDHAEGDVDTSSLREELRSYTPVIERLVERNKAEHPYGLGRLDAFGAILNQVCEAGLGIPENHRPANAPVSYPFLWDTPHLDWVQWNSSVDIPISRNVGEVLGVFAHATLTADPAEEQFRSSARIDYLHRLETQLRELQAPQWPAAIFGKIDQEKAAAGKRLFAANCAGCHNSRDEQGEFAMTAANEFGKRFIKTKSIPFQQIGTDPQMAINFITRIAKPGDLEAFVRPALETEETQAGLKKLKEVFAALGLPEPDFDSEVPAAMLLAAAVRGVTERHLGEELRFRSAEEREAIRRDLMGHRSPGTPPNGGGGYKARPLNGVWATAPFGHNGAVPNLYQWLLPEDQRVTSFHVGSREFDVKHVGFSVEPVAGAFLFQTQTTDGKPIPGNSNKGHSGPGHTDFTDEERWQLIEYVKTLN